MSQSYWCQGPTPWLAGAGARAPLVSETKWDQGQAEWWIDSAALRPANLTSACLSTFAEGGPWRERLPETSGAPCAQLPSLSLRALEQDSKTGATSVIKTEALRYLLHLPHCCLNDSVMHRSWRLPGEAPFAPRLACQLLCCSLFGLVKALNMQSYVVLCPRRR